MPPSRKVKHNVQDGTNQFNLVSASSRCFQSMLDKTMVNHLVTKQRKKEKKK